ncbi:BAD_collapsed_G0005870.mRNA.1.CDS.1 [Saccharomyces cerevisiae]|nr:AMM_1a_G0005830.mRNA.1.CDS.1 [Saccharomyces cerevisiae]CAI4936887.1 BAD_HP_G0020280.mRNA.1.CDS.1 [Saccharomyces cerevisiae]CAI4996554.1 BAD_HP_G0063280.mRNA.1.CDS.1 [Saccharomyces cerevisiae]CAI6520741.1 AMM_1a_G0005830.mRNA.1.CDS.1 [Saccharomyces cerevisiae]CAI6525580.1 BAD_HP_G0020280.mRNA.1.CDS.1 [Saccharomyces cerevisiae]
MHAERDFYLDLKQAETRRVNSFLNEEVYVVIWTSSIFQLLSFTRRRNFAFNKIAQRGNIPNSIRVAGSMADSVSARTSPRIPRAPIPYDR